MQPLRRLARAYGVMTRYTGADRKERIADDEALLAVLRLLGAPIERASDAGEALRERRIARAMRHLPRSIVAWHGESLVLTVRGDARDVPPTRLYVRLEGAEQEQTLEITGHELVGRSREEVDGRTRTVWRFRFEPDLPPGRHRIRTVDEETATSTLLVAPKRMHPGADALAERRAWGVFMPVYALRPGTVDQPIGDLDDLAALMEWVDARGGHVVGTLPMLAGAPGQASPYSPVSRLFWNEVFLGAPGMAGTSADAGASASATAGTSATAGSSSSDAGAALVDYDAAFAAVRARLEAEARELWDGESEPQVVRELLRARPDADEYARFRATWERHGESWHTWPDRQRSGAIEPGDYEEDARRYHLLAQARMHERLSALAESARERGAGLYLDMPLGVHPDGYDVWRYRDRFAMGASVGAPPDAFFTRGQDWGFPPVNPDSMRDGGFDYMARAIRNHVRYAGVLRLDHVMGLHRQFWIPNGMDASRGVYVRYPAREMYAILAIESHRHACAIVGEDLGTVPENVRSGMRRHAVRGMHVVQFAVAPDRSPVAAEPGADSVASLNTHDMPTFAAFWTGRDLRQRVEWGLLDEEEAAREAEDRQRLREAAARELGLDPAPTVDAALAVARAWLEELAGSDAALVLVGVEDLWGELRPHNVPGTSSELPNWRRRAALTMEEIATDRRVTDALEEIDRLRREKSGS